MLKLTNSFYRYLTVTCERVDYKAHVKKYSHLCRIREILKASCVDLKLKRQSNCYSILQQHNNSKKRPKIKIPSLNIDELDKSSKMSETGDISMASYGGTFVVSSDDNSSGEENKKSKRKSKGVKTKIPPNFRCWENLCDTDDDNTFKFKVVSYNVLAQYLLECHPHLYTECSARDLKWKVRSARLYDEIVTLDPDIICLQEVQVSHLNSFYSKFEKIGYKGVFKQKTGQRLDGCAIYYKKSIFDLKEQLSVEFYQPNMPVLNRDNVGVMVKLVPRHAPQNPVVVATTHLLYNPKRADVRLAQMQLFMAEIDRFAFFTKGIESGHLPIILTGDFNSTPDSDVVQLLSKGHVSCRTIRNNCDWERIGVTDNCQHLSVYLNRRAGRDTEFRTLKIYNSEYNSTRPEPETPTEGRTPGPFNLLFNGNDLWLTLPLSSVYDRMPIDDGVNVSTFQDRWVAVDYIYFSSCSNVQLTDRLRLPTAEECQVLKRLPNEVFASDHLALAAVFAIPLTRGTPGT